MEKWDLKRYNHLLPLRIFLFIISLVIISYFVIKNNIEILSIPLILFLIVLLFNAAITSNKNIISLDSGQVRRSIAITFTMAYFILLFKDQPKGEIEISYFCKNFTYLYGIIITFYFGTRAFERKK